MSTSFAVLGIHGYGQQHLKEIAALTADGVAELVAVADPRGAEGVENIPDGVPCYSSLNELLQAGVPDVVVLATPIHTHAPLAVTAMRAGAHVLLEKPTTASLAEFDEVVAVSEETGRVVQVGFQSFGSHAFAEIDRLLAEGAIGEVTGIGGIGTWLRTRAYYARSRWAGMRTLDGVAVVDGVVTNPLSHAVATALRVAGCRRSDDVARVEVELFHAHAIEADDTSSVRVTTADGRPLTFALTLCAPDHPDPVVVVRGTTGTLTLHYTTDLLVHTDAEGTRTEQQLGRTSVVRNLIDHLADPGVALLAPVAETGAFMQVLEAVRTAPDPVAIDPAHVTWVDEGDAAHPVLHDVVAWCERAVEAQQLFSEVGAPWATATP